MSEQEVARLEEQVKNLGRRSDDMERRFTDWCTELAKSSRDMDEKWDKRIKGIEDELSKRLPNWATALITVMGSVITGLIVKLAGG